MTDRPAANEHSKVEVRGLQLHRDRASFDFSARAGEVVGLGGLERAGQDRFLQVLAGLEKPVAGTVEVVSSDGTAESVTSFASARDAGVAYLPRDRRVEGILPGRSVRENFMLLTRRRFTRAGVINVNETRAAYDNYADTLRIKAASPDVDITTLSGGNQQKVLVARLLQANPRVLLLNDPTRGVDHRTRISLYEHFLDVAANGCVVIVVSSEMSELTGYCKRVIVFRDDEAAGELTDQEVTEHNIVSLMFGSKSAEERSA